LPIPSIPFLGLTQAHSLCSFLAPATTTTTLYFYLTIFLLIAVAFLPGSGLDLRRRLGPISSFLHACIACSVSLELRAMTTQLIYTSTFKHSNTHSILRPLLVRLGKPSDGTLPPGSGGTASPTITMLVIAVPPPPAFGTRVAHQAQRRMLVLGTSCRFHSP
jgi:hypothetical protein